MKVCFIILTFMTKMVAPTQEVFKMIEYWFHYERLSQKNKHLSGQINMCLSNMTLFKMHGRDRILRDWTPSSVELEACLSQEDDNIEVQVYLFDETESDLYKIDESTTVE